MNRVLVIGGDGQIGGALGPALRREGHQIAQTSRRRRWHTRRLDLTQIDGDPTEGFDTVVITAAVTGRKACADDPEGSAVVNVVAPVRLAGPVLTRGGRVIFLSTHVVLGGAVPRLAVDADYAPCDPYSEQKARAETDLLALPGAAENLAIVRPTKVLDRKRGTVGNWIKHVRDRRGFDAYSDLMMAPIHTSHVADRIAGMVSDWEPGIHHLSGWPEISFADFAVRLGNAMKWPQALIRRKAGRPINPIAQQTPPHASLDCPMPVATDQVVRALAR